MQLLNEMQPQRPGNASVKVNAETEMGREKEAGEIRATMCAACICSSFCNGYDLVIFNWIFSPRRRFCAKMQSRSSYSEFHRDSLSHPSKKCCTKMRLIFDVKPFLTLSVSSSHSPSPLSRSFAILRIANASSERTHRQKKL